MVIVIVIIIVITIMITTTTMTMTTITISTRSGYFWSWTLQYAGYQRPLHRRVTVKQYTTVEYDNNSTQTNIYTNPHSNALRSAITFGGRNKQRMKWSDEINTQLLHCYYTVINLEIDLTEYRPLLHQNSLKTYPKT